MSKIKVPCILAISGNKVSARLQECVAGDFIVVEDIYNTSHWEKLAKSIHQLRPIVFVQDSESPLNTVNLARLIKKYFPDANIVGIAASDDVSDGLEGTEDLITAWIYESDISQKTVSQYLKKLHNGGNDVKFTELINVLFSSSMDGVIVLSRNAGENGEPPIYQIEYLNSLAWNAMEVFHRDFGESERGSFLPPIWINSLSESLETVWETSEPMESEVDFGRKFPLLQWFHYRVLKYSDYLFVILRNITRLKNERSQSMENNEIFRTVLQSLRSHIWVLDENAVVSEVNDRWSNQLTEDDSGFYFRKGIGRSFRGMFETICENPELARQTEQAVRKIIEDGVGSYIHEYTKPSLSGDGIQYYLMTVTPLQGPSKGAVVSHLNITDQKMMEIQLDASRYQQHLVSGLGNLALSGYPSISLAKTMIRYALEGLNAEIAAVYLMEQGKETLRLLEWDRLNSTIHNVPESIVWKGTEQEISLSQGRFVKNANTGRNVSFEPSSFYSLAHPSAIYVGAILLRSGVWGNFVVTSKNDKAFSNEEVVFLEGLMHVLSTSLEREDIDFALKSQIGQLATLRDLELAVVSEKDLSEILDMLLKQMLHNLKLDAAAISLADNNGRLWVEVHCGIADSKARLVDGLFPGSQAPMVFLSQTAAYSDDMKAESKAEQYLLSESGQKLKSYYALPLTAKGQRLGVIELFHHEQFPRQKEWSDFLEALCIQVSLAVYSTSLSHELGSRNQELEQAYDQTLEGWSMALDFRDRETKGHSIRVTKGTVRLSRAMGIPEEELVHIRRGALLHDIGKMGIPDSILLKPGPLDEKEWEIMKLHPVYAQQMIEPISFLLPAIDIPFCHHERWDGKGYPQGLRGEEIPLAARVFAVIDVWDALRSDRPYRKGWPTSKIIQYIEENSGTHFDPAIVKVFMELWEKEGPSAFGS